ncbi:hypothetical protein GCM10027265_22590 [Jatrophihabitans fulvus]
MGELRNAITELTKLVGGAAQLGDKLGQELDSITSRSFAHVQRLEGGVDVLWTYVVAKFEKDNRVVRDFANDTLAQHSDTEIVQLLKGIDAAIKEVEGTIKEHAAVKSMLPAEYKRIDALAAAIAANIQKKRSKLLQSKAYKTKIAGYEATLTTLTTAVNDRRDALKDFEGLRMSVLDPLRISGQTKLGELEKQCTLTVKNSIKNMKSDVEKGRYVSRRFRENGDMKQVFEQMKRFAAEADAMDQEVINLDPNAVKPIKDIKIFSGTRLVGTATKATYQGKRPMEVPAVTWVKGVDTLKLLQTKITLKGQYENGGGDFANDMKVAGIQGGTTLKLQV